MSTRGVFLALEGADGAGTTTQARAVADAMAARGRAVHVTQEPSSGPIGALLRQMLRQPSGSELGWRSLALLFAADRLHHYEREIVPALDEGRFVISDRYALSSLVYQSLHAPLEWVETLNRFAPSPDLTVVLDVSLDEAWARQERRNAAREVYDEREVQRDVLERYRALAPRVGAVVVEGAGEIADVTERIVREIDARGLG